MLYHGSYGVMVSTLDFESKDPSSNLGRTWVFISNNDVAYRDLNSDLNSEFLFSNLNSEFLFSNFRGWFQRIIKRALGFY